VLRSVRDGRRFQDALESATSGLSDTDRRLTHEIAAGVLRSRAQLDARLRPLVSVPWHRLTPDLLDLLRIGAYQVQYLDRVPQYAALSTTVELAKEVGGSRTAGLVNAVLRRLQPANTTSEPADSVATLAERHSHPVWLVERWVNRFGWDRAAALLRHNNTRPALTLRPVRVSQDDLRRLLQSHGVAFADAPFGLGLTVVASRVRSLPGYRDGAFVVQDAAQGHLLQWAAIPDRALVWDACAAPGGKSVALAPRCRVLASDRRRDRLRMLRDTVTRTATDVSLFLADARRPPLGAGRIEVALVDAPCSATGTMARHPDARWRLTEAHIARAAARQAEILDAAAGLLGSDGLLVYLTCSLEEEENERQVEGFLDRHAGFRRDGNDLFVFPPDAGTDGGYAARLRRIA